MAVCIFRFEFECASSELTKLNEAMNKKELWEPDCVIGWFNGRMLFDFEVETDYPAKSIREAEEKVWDILEESEISTPNIDLIIENPELPDLGAIIQQEINKEVINEILKRNSELF